MAEEQPVDVNGIIKARMMSDGQNHSNNSQNFVALLNNATVLHNHDSVGQVGNHTKVVGNQNHAHSEAGL